MTRKEIRKEYRLKKRELKKNFNNDKRELEKEYINKINEVLEIDQTKEVPFRYTLEEIGNAISHGLGSLFAIAAFILMLFKVDTKVEMFSTIVYFVGLFLLFTMSCLYHAFKYGSKVKRLFRRFDYSSIYLLIGSTFAPILLCYIGGIKGNIFFIIQWIAIIVGITMISIFGPGKLKWLHFPLYIILGWSGLMFLPYMIKNNIMLFVYILGGGLFYTGGLIPFSIDKKVSHFIWHFFVLIGAIVQWFGIYLYIL